MKSWCLIQKILQGTSRPDPMYMGISCLTRLFCTLEPKNPMVIIILHLGQVCFRLKSAKSILHQNTSSWVPSHVQSTRMFEWFNESNGSMVSPEVSKKMGYPDLWMVYFMGNPLEMELHDCGPVFGTPPNYMMSAPLRGKILGRLSTWCHFVQRRMFTILE